MLLSEGQMSDYKGAALMLPALPKAGELLADKGYDAVLYKLRHKIENMFGRLKDWRRIHTRYDRCAHTYFSAICIAAALAFWL